MTPQEVQLLADTIKVGFPVLGTVVGALIGGISTYAMSRLNHRNDQRKDLTKRRFELLIQCANDVAEYEHMAGLFIAAILRKIKDLPPTIDLDETRRIILNNNQPLRRARMTLKILGLNDAAAKLELYVVLTRETVNKDTTLTKERATELAAQIVAGPVSFYESLSHEVMKN